MELNVDNVDSVLSKDVSVVNFDIFDVVGLDGVRGPFGRGIFNGEGVVKVVVVVDVCVMFCDNVIDCVIKCVDFVGLISSEVFLFVSDNFFNLSF